jgi:hypothetical protein
MLRCWRSVPASGAVERVVRRAAKAPTPPPRCSRSLSGWWLLLHVSTSRLGETSSGAARGSERNYSELGGLAGGGMRPRLPPMPATGMMASRPVPAAQPLLVLRVDATEAQNTRIAWVASMQCRMTGSDEGLLAQELGRVIGAVAEVARELHRHPEAVRCICEREQKARALRERFRREREGAAERSN